MYFCSVLKVLRTIVGIEVNHKVESHYIAEAMMYRSALEVPI